MATEGDGAAVDDVTVPLRCFRCDHEQPVPLAHWRAGAVLRCGGCRVMIVPTLPMATAVRAAVADFRARHPSPLGDADRAALTERLRDVLADLRPPGAPVPRRGFFSF